MKIELLPEQKLWFTSDTHYNHSNICRGTSTWDTPENTRDFDTINEMNDQMVNNINELVGEEDILIHLGDWSFGGFKSIPEFRKRINCKYIHIVCGNHDEHILNNHNNIQLLFASVQEYLHLVVNKQHIICMHYPIASWNGMHRGNIHLHGHMHSKSPITGANSMDVGMDPNNLKPIELTTILDTLSKPIF